MASVNGVKANKKNKEDKNGGSAFNILAAVIITALSVLLAIMLLWKFVFEERVALMYTQTTESENVMLYKSNTDLVAGDSLSGVVSLVPVPKELATYTAYDNSTNLDSLRASKTIRANELITSDNTYNPLTQDIVLSTSRQVVIDYIETPGINQGDFIDIRVKSYDKGVYRDSIVCSKKEVLAKEGEVITLMLSESEILNINNAVVEVASGSKDSESKIYATKYVDVANQPKANVTYSGTGTQYTEQEVAEAQQRLKSISKGEPDYESPKVN